MKIALDYTEYAEPVTIELVKNGMDAFFAITDGGEPNKIIMWRHQLDWLIKSAPGPVAPHVRRGERLWSVPLEIRA